MRLLACPGCERHVRATETECPFCAQKLEGLAPRALGPLPSRAAAVFIGATALAGCGKEPAPEPQKPGPIDNGMMAVPAYGVPPQDLQPPPTPTPPPDAGPPKDAGPPPKDAGKPK